MRETSHSQRILSLLASRQIRFNESTQLVERCRKNQDPNLESSWVPVAEHLNNGYRRISRRWILADGRGINMNVKVHRIAWISRHGIPPSGMVICHRDNDKNNCALDNLFLQSASDNTKKAWMDGLIQTWKLSKDTKDQVICAINSGLPISAVARSFGITANAARRLLRNRKSA